MMGTAYTNRLALLDRAGASSGWMPGELRPRFPGIYERQSALGIRQDVWDGKTWRRPSSQAKVQQTPEGEGLGVVCANQELPWRTPQ